MEKTGRQHLLAALKQLEGRELKELRAKLSQVWLRRGQEGGEPPRGAAPFQPSPWRAVEVTAEGLSAEHRADLAEELAGLLAAYEAQRREQRAAASGARRRLLGALNELGEDELGRFKVQLADVGRRGGYNPIPWGLLGRAKPAEVAAVLVGHYGLRGGLETAGEVLGAIRRGELAGALAEARAAYEERCRGQSQALAGVREMQARALGSLGEESLRRIRERAAETPGPRGGQERAAVLDEIEELVSAYGEGQAMRLSQEMLRAVKPGPLAERLAEAAGIAGDGPDGEDHPKGQQQKCAWCRTEEDLPEVKPELVLGTGEKPTSYRFHLPGAGSFRCSETELGFVVRAAVTVQYGYDSWARRLGASERQQWMVAGPLFSIRAEPAGAVAAVHLPHFLCLAGAADESSRAAVLSQLQVAHIADGGLTLEEPAQVRPFHAVLENPSFSFVGVLWRPLCAIFPFIPIHSVGLIYRVLQAADITLHLYLIPNDRSLIQAVDDEERKHRSIQVLKPPQTKPLYFGSHYTVSSSLDLEVTPEEVEFRYMSPEDQQPFMEIYTRGMTEGLKLVLVMKGYGEVLWKVWVRPEDVMLLGSSSEKFKGLQKLLPELQRGFGRPCSRRELGMSPPAAWSSPAQPVDEEAERDPHSSATCRAVANETQCGPRCQDRQEASLGIPADGELLRPCDWPAMVSSGDSWEVIQRLRSKLTRILQSDVEAVISAADAHLLLTPAEYRTLNQLEDPGSRVATLIEMVLAKGEQAHQLFLNCMRHLGFTFPGLEPIVAELQTGFQADVVIPRPGAQTEGPEFNSSLLRPSPDSAEGEHFVDRHRAALIQRVSMVDGVLDMLCGTVLDSEQYQNIRAERSNPEKMRKLYELMPSWNRVCKDQLYQALKAKQKFLIEDLEGK